MKDFSLDFIGDVLRIGGIGYDRILFIPYVFIPIIL